MDYLTDDGDVHVCGYCKQSFPRLDKWLEHKQLQWCKAQPYHPSRLGGRVHSAPHQLHHDLVLATGSVTGSVPQSSPGSGLLHRPYQHSPPDSQPHDLSTGSVKGEKMEYAGSGDVHVYPGGSEHISAFPAPIRKTVYPIMPPNRKRERARPRKQESPQPLTKLEESSPTPSDSLVAASPGSEDVTVETQWYPVKRSRPGSTSGSLPTSRPAGLGLRKDIPPVSVIVPTPSTSSPGGASVGSVFSPEQQQQPSTQAEITHPRRPLVLPRVYSCPRCSKSFIKLSHLHRHMNKKKPCEAKDASDAVDDQSDSEEIVTLPSLVIFTCGLCSEQYRSYEEMIAHHSEKHPAYYPGYCKFCGKFQDRKNKLLIHLVKHDHSQIVDEVAQEVKRIRHTKIDKPTATAATHHLTAAAATPSSAGSGVMGGHSAQVAAAQAAAMFVNPLGLPPHQLSSLQGSLSALGGASSQMAHHHMAAMAAASAAMQGEVNCPCCRKRLPDRDELLCHFRDYHLPIGCLVADSEILDLLTLDEKEQLSVGADPDSLRCFICCLRFTNRNSFDAHTQYHQVWSEKVQPVVANGSPEPLIEQQIGLDENRNPTNKPAEIIQGSIAPTDSEVDKLEETNNNRDRVMDLSMSSKKLDRSSVSSAGSTGSPMETVPLDFPCWLCTDQHSDLESWRDHINSAHKLPLLYRCPVEDCRKEVDLWEELRSHMQQHNHIKNFICRVCNDHHPSMEALNQHSLSHIQSKTLPAVCSHCHCLVEENMELHRIKCLQELIDCQECNEKVKRLAMVKHMLNHSALSGKTYKCDQCESMFPLRDRLNQHVKNVHGPRKFVCTDCGAAFKRNDKLQRHCQSRHSDVKPYLCPIVSCGRAFKRVDGLRAHVRCSHVNSESLANVMKNHYGCTVCGKLLPGQEKLVDHLMSHVKASPPAVSASSLSGELYGSGGPHDMGVDDNRPSTSSSALGHFECPHCHIKVANESLFYAHLVQHSQVAFQSSALPFPPGFFFMGQNTALPSPKTE